MDFKLRTGIVIAAGIIAGALLSVSTISSAASLHEEVQYTLKTNPDVLIEIKRRHEAVQVAHQSAAGYFPVLDAVAESGGDRTKNFSTGQAWADLYSSEAGATLSENIFNGFQTYFNLKADLRRIASASYAVANQSQNTALAVAEAYLNVLREKELVRIVRNNVRTHAKTTSMIKKRVDKGISRLSELRQSRGRLALARSNLLAEQNTYRDAIDTYIEVVGKKPGRLITPRIRSALLKLSKNQAVALGIKNNPSVHGADYNLYAAMADHKAAYGPGFPKVDLLLTSVRARNLNGIAGDNYQDQIELQVNYNIFRGGADWAREQETAYRKQESFEEIRKTERTVIEGVSNAWNAMIITQRQLKQLYIHKVDSKAIIGAYRKQYTLGKRTLVDLLNAENEYLSASRAYTNGKTNLLLAKFRLLNGMGELTQALHVTQPKEANLNYSAYEESLKMKNWPGAAHHKHALAPKSEPVTPRYNRSMPRAEAINRRASVVEAQARAHNYSPRRHQKVAAEKLAAPLKTHAPVRKAKAIKPVKRTRLATHKIARKKLIKARRKHHRRIASHNRKTKLLRRKTQHKKIARHHQQVKKTTLFKLPDFKDIKIFSSAAKPVTIKPQQHRLSKVHKKNLRQSKSALRHHKRRHVRRALSNKKHLAKKSKSSPIIKRST